MIVLLSFALISAMVWAIMERHSRNTERTEHANTVEAMTGVSVAMANRHLQEHDEAALLIEELQAKHAPVAAAIVPEVIRTAKQRAAEIKIRKSRA